MQLKKKFVLTCTVLWVCAMVYGQPSQSSFTEEDVAYEDKNENAQTKPFLQATSDVVLPQQTEATSESTGATETSNAYKNSVSAPLDGGQREFETRHPYHSEEAMHGGGNRPGHRPPPPPPNGMHGGNLPGGMHGGRPPIEEWRTTLVIKSNVTGAHVYLDGEYYGTTPLTVQNIMPGSYEVNLFMDGYEMYPQRIRIFNGHETTYFVQMQKRAGFLQVLGINGEFFVYSDGRLLHDVINRLDEGYHTIRIRKFGYEDFYAQIFIQAHMLKKITVTLEKAEFGITSFAASKKSFNPTYEGSVGSCVFEAEVTAPGSGTLSIKDSNGSVVFEHIFSRFSTWTQRVSWQGTDANGAFLPQGMYTAVFSAREADSSSSDSNGSNGSTVFSGSGDSEGKEFLANARTSIDYTLVYHLADITESGLGFGSVPAALIMPKGSVNLQLQVSPNFSLNNNKNQVPIGIGLYIAPLEFMDISGKFSYNAEKGNTSLIASADMRFLFSKEIGKNHLNYGLSIEYGWSNNNEFFPYGVAMGAGINPSLMIGVDTEKVFFGLTTQCAFGALSSNPLGNDNVWKNSLELSIKPHPRLSLDIAASLHSAFGDFESYGGEAFECDWTRAVELFAGTSVMLSGVPLIFKLALKSFIFPHGEAFLGFSAGLNYLFLK